MQSKSAGIEAAGSIRTAPSSRLLQTAGVAVVAATALVIACLNMCGFCCLGGYLMKQN